MQKTICAFLIIVGVLPSYSQVQAPMEVVKSGIAAVNDLGANLVKGHYNLLYDRMYPDWRKLLAKKMGGEEKLEKQCDSTGQVLAKNAITLTRFTSTGFPTVFEVSPGKELKVVNGKDVEVAIYTKWLLLVPTISHYRVVAKDGVHIMESTSFQVAVSDKSNIAWTFIDGPTVTLPELRSLFISLPANLTLPKQEKKLQEKK